MTHPSPSNQESQKYSADYKLLNHAFPFFMEWDQELRIRAVGRSLHKICPEAEIGASLSSIFYLRRPVGELTADFFSNSSSLLILFESVQSGILLRGEVLPSEHLEGFFMLATPWISDPREIERLDLTLSDFALHDQTLDMLQLIQVQRMANDDLQLLAKKLTTQRGLLRHQEAEARKLALIAARTDNAVILTDADGLIEWVNHGFFNLTGWTLEEVKGKKPGHVLQGPETNLETVAYIRAQLACGEGYQVELINYDKQGNKYWVASEVQPVKDESGKIINFMAIQSNITRRKEKDQALRKTNSLQRAMLDSAGFAIISTNIEGEIQLFNAAAERMLGYSAEEIIRDQISPSIFHDREEVVRRAAELSAELGYEIAAGFDVFTVKARMGQPEQREWTYIRKDHSRLPVLLSVSALIDGANEVYGFLGIATDLSERKNAEEQLRTTLSELEMLNHVMMSREERVLELKEEVNELCTHHQLSKRYNLERSQ